MILGVGIDIVQIPRVEEMLKNQGEKMLQRLLAKEEQVRAAKYKDAQLAAFVARRFAVKEAVAKALGCGIGAEVGFQDIVSVQREKGAPELQMTQALERCLQARFPQMKNYDIQISVSDDYPIAIALAVISADVTV